MSVSVNIIYCVLCLPCSRTFVLQEKPNHHLNVYATTFVSGSLSSDKDIASGEKNV